MNLKELSKIIIEKPIITEKSMALSESDKYQFKVSPKATKKEIKKAIELLFKVKVESVNIMNYQGKKRRRGRIEGKTSSWKKATVTLKKGDKIELFEGV